MAKFNVTGLELVIKDMHRMGEQSGAVAQEMLQDGASVVVDAWQTAIQSHGHVDTGAMMRAVRPTKIKSAGDMLTITVYPQGKDKRGVRNAEKAFIKNFGRRHEHGSGFVTKAENAAEAPAQAAMEAVWDRFIG